MKFGVLLPTRLFLLKTSRTSGINSIIKMVETVEKANLDSVWVGDSLTAKPRLEPLSVLAAIATRTKRVRIGTAVMLGALRHPVLLSHSAATVDLISGGRLVLGLGVGGAFNEAQRKEWRNAGIDPASRATRFEEVVKLVKRLTRGDTVTHDGNHFSIKDVEIAPISPNKNGTHILIACHWHAGKDRQFLRAATLGDGYISISDQPDEYAKVTTRIKEHAMEHNRDFNLMERAFYMTINLGHDCESATNEANKFLELYYGMNIWEDKWGPYGPAELIIDQIHRYISAGAQTIIVRFASFNQERQLETFLNKVVPAF